MISKEFVSDIINLLNNYDNFLVKKGRYCYICEKINDSDAMNDMEAFIKGNAYYDVEYISVFETIHCNRATNSEGYYFDLHELKSKNVKIIGIKDYQANYDIDYLRLLIDMSLIIKDKDYFMELTNYLNLLLEKGSDRKNHIETLLDMYKI